VEAFGRSVVRQITDKKAIRSHLLAARAALPAETLAESAAAVARHLTRLLNDTPPTRNHAVIAAYVPFGHEPGGDLPELLARLLPTATVLLPVVLADRDLDWAAYQPGELTGPAVPTVDGGERRVSALREPVGSRLGRAAIERAGLVIVPALAVDRHGNRLGRGGGSYDRALARIAPDALTVALLHDGELLDELPAEKHDRPVRLVITPAGRHPTAM
jgi:5-formyltetrahydrofolate cyclo-ligase